MVKVGVIGLGLIGGSIAKDLNSQLNVVVHGADNNTIHCTKALELGLVDAIHDTDNLLSNCDVVILAIPVHLIESLLPLLLDQLDQSTTIIDVGSTKKAICQSVSDHPNRGRYVAAHPLAGTEYSGPESALKGLFVGKKNIICEKEKSDKDALKISLKIFNSIGMQTYFLSPEDHDRHLAYVSHLSHISSFTLSLTVLDIEKDEDQIFNLASTGFESTVRLAKSNPNTWTPIFSKNKKYLIEALDSYTEYLTKFRNYLAKNDEEELNKLMVNANNIKRILK